MLTEVLKEREAQMELKRLREASECGDNEQTRAKLRDEYEQSLRIELDERQKARDAKVRTVEFQKAQYDTVSAQRHLLTLLLCFILTCTFSHRLCSVFLILLFRCCMCV